MYTVISFVVLFLLRYILIKLVRNFSSSHRKLERRTNLIIKYIDIAIVFIVVFWNILIWGVDFSDVGIVFSSVFAIIGVALFAQWSILSNVTSGVIMFFTFPYRIGDTILIHDKDFVMEPLIIDDIRTFQVMLRNEKGEILTYPNNLFLQKGITLITDENYHLYEDLKQSEEKNVSKTHD